MAKIGRDQHKQVAAKHVTTRRLARWQREKRRQRITFLSGVVIVVIVLGVIIGGVIATRSSDWLSKVQTDSGTVTIKKADYLDVLNLYRLGVYNSSTMTNESPLATIEDGYLLQDKAKELGISPSETEIDNVILSSFGMANSSMSNASFQTQYNNMLSKLGISSDEFRDIMETSLTQSNLLGYFVNETPTSGEQAAVQTIILYNESAANEVSQRWRMGEMFESLAEEYGAQSSYGWLIQGLMGEEFDSVAFSLDIGNVSDPIPSETAYYVIKVLERKSGTIEDALRQQVGLANYNKWFSEAYTEKVERNPNLNLTEIYAWAVQQLS